MPLTRPTLAELRDRTASDFISRLNLGPLLPRMVIKILADVLAGVVHSLYGYIQWAARQLFPDTAELEFLDRWLSIFGLIRKPSTFSTGNMTFTGTAGSVIPAGTAMLRSDGVEYTTTAEGTLSGSPATATIPVTAAVAGSNGTTPAGQIFTLVSPIAGVNSNPTVAGGDIAGGSNEEGDEAARGRLMQRIQQPPQGGAEHDYEAWALEVSGVTRVWVYPLYLGPGTVGVAIVADDAEDGPIASEQLVEDTQAHVDEKKPVTAHPTVFTPEAVELDLNITLTPDTTIIRNAVIAELRDMLRREAKPGSTIYISKIREAISIAAGEDHHVLNSPTSDIVTTTGQLLVLGDITWSV